MRGNGIWCEGNYEMKLVYYRRYTRTHIFVRSIGKDRWIAPVSGRGARGGRKRRGRRFNLSVVPARVFLRGEGEEAKGEGGRNPWRYSRHASHARKLARDRALVARVRAKGSRSGKCRGGGRRGREEWERDSRRREGGREMPRGRKRGVLKRD